MATCNRCGAETQLYDTGYPICTACSDTLPAKSADNINLTLTYAQLSLPHE